MPVVRPEVVFDAEGRLIIDRLIAELTERECCQGEQCAPPRRYPPKSADSGDSERSLSQ